MTYKRGEVVKKVINTDILNILKDIQNIKEELKNKRIKKLVNKAQMIKSAGLANYFQLQEPDIETLNNNMSGFTYVDKNMVKQLNDVTNIHLRTRIKAVREAEAKKKENAEVEARQKAEAEAEAREKEKAEAMEKAKAEEARRVREAKLQEERLKAKRTNEAEARKKKRRELHGLLDKIDIYGFGEEKSEFSGRIKATNTMQQLNNIEGEIQEFEIKVKAIETKRGNLKNLLKSKNVESRKKIVIEQRIDTATNMNTLDQIGENIVDLKKTTSKVDSGLGREAGTVLHKKELKNTRRVR